MTGIPSWAVKGAKCVLIDCSQGEVHGPDCASEGDVCEIVDVVLFGGEVPACRCREINGKWATPPTMWARLSRFRPLATRSLEQDMFVHFSQHMRTDQRVPEKA